ncbi:CATC-like protein [Mya arenaria]|uniref:Dipeptidyl peptidase 1 n=1 Tax=Mya arenaria TaxID=6604 RepID=A0ABY7FW38_MYAAR|nr:dipeptidyl peptidase 1-like [Mya arenaria]XP_052779899.1 dipeptidyl peptidase 1-like [Mya arenaria]XP_052779901.1 dipeptidyl peptidase 1-like [Mya arenaria]XP_052779902.1 dipeptidyl peptidase 1-like [Mya arenaria]XP_052779903.1 dipeptidyl peptidase 1-like [Mya arenaria]WAR25374.1 CATC-like protein [Mya arenaria]
MFRELAVVAILVGSISADTPANCTYQDLLGQWNFQIGESGYDRTLNCSNFGSLSNPAKSKLMVTLYFPDLAIDEFGNHGWWTLIYNQGFEVVLSGRKYFAFSMYKKDGSTYESMCDQTLPGWSHDIFGRNWACYSGSKVERLPLRYQKHVLSSSPVYAGVKYQSDAALVSEINRAQRSWRAVKYPQFERMDIEDMIKMAGGRKSRIPSIPKPAPATPEHTRLADNLPTEFDWRNVDGMNYVSPIRNQGSCGSCYAFASMGMNEARWRIMTNNTVTPVFSPQDVVECSEYSQGCEGGFPYLIGGKYAEDFGLVLEECNPYKGRDGTCSTLSNCPRLYSTKYEYIGGFYGACNEDLMRINLVKNGPMAVAFEVYNDFFNYKGGVYHHTGLQDRFNPFEITNHAVLLVGYGTDRTNPDAPENYWIVKNSWGEGWGEDGYFRIRRGTDECSIESIAVQAFPIM